MDWKSLASTVSAVKLTKVEGYKKFFKVGRDAKKVGVEEGIMKRGCGWEIFGKEKKLCENRYKKINL